MLTIAIPKGRVLKKLLPLLENASLPTELLQHDDRTLIRTSEEHALQYLLLKPDDVPTYVEYGAADLGIVGRDIVDEHDHALYRLLDLRIGLCRMSVAGLSSDDLDAWPLRVATKYRQTAQRHFHQKRIQAEIIDLKGSIELAPLTGLSHVIVDLIETGTTLAKNGLVELEKVADISSLLVSNQASLKIKFAEVSPLVARLRSAVLAQTAT